MQKTSGMKYFDLMGFGLMSDIREERDQLLLAEVIHE